MKEALFIKINRKKWIEIEEKLDSSDVLHPDKLTDYLVRLSDDLSFVKSNYENSKTHIYLNELTSRIYQHIYKNKKVSSKRFLTFWKTEFPMAIFSARKQLLYAFLIFGTALIIGIFSSAYDDNFARLILGDAYINMTESNINNNDPMAVYKEQHQVDMFFGITFNNIRVSFMAFAAGLLFSVGSGYVLFTNGVMLGAFQYFFYQKGLLWTSFLTIWIHGAIEISSIVIAGAAGLVMGNSFLFPGSYQRTASFRRGAKHGLKIVIGLIPLFILAGFLESFVTRLTDWPNSLKLFIILGTFSAVIYYTLIYPYILKQHERKLPTEDPAF